MPAKYLNLIRFPRSLSFKDSGLGSWRKIVVGELVGRIWLPRSNVANLNAGFNVLLPPRAGDIDFVSKVEARGQNEHVYWGEYFTYNVHDPANTAVAAVSAAILTIPKVQADGEWTVNEVGKECIKEFPKWGNRLADWIEVLTSDDLNVAHPLQAIYNPERWTSAAWISASPDGRDYQFINPSINIVLNHGENAMDSGHWSAAVRAANEARDLPEVWGLLRDARAAQRRRQFRRAVLDAATSAELIIDQELRGRLLRTNTHGFVETLMKGTWQVSRRMELMAALSMWLPADLSSKLTELRNKVIHKNVVVTPQLAREAVDAANDLARHYASSLLN